MLTGHIISWCKNVSISKCFSYSSFGFMVGLRLSRIGSYKLCQQSSYQSKRNLTSWRLYKTSNYFTYYNKKTSVFSGPVECFSSYSFCSNDSLVKKASKLKDSEKETSKKGKKEIKTYITLLKGGNSMQVTTLDDALKLASRRNYKLVKTLELDSKTGRAVYKMVTESQYLTEDEEWLGEIPIRKETSIKAHKVVSISSNINEHDLITKVKLMKKWLAKKAEVRVVISGEKNLSENLYTLIEKELGEDGRILQKRVKGNDIRFQIIPPKKSEKQDSYGSHKNSI